ncbi:uncharacterized protein METZ01_LOCUS261785, partial [marine metagenome]
MKIQWLLLLFASLIVACSPANNEPTTETQQPAQVADAAEAAASD